MDTHSHRVAVAYDFGTSEHYFSSFEVALEFINSPEPIMKGSGVFYPRSRVVSYELKELPV